MNLTNVDTPGLSFVSIVDDDPSMRSSTRRLLRSSGLRAEAFSSGADFLRSECVEKTDCLLLDVCMPGMDGLELQRLLKKKGYQIPIVFVSAKASDEQECRAMGAGAAAFLRKPARTESLLNAIREAIARRESQRLNGPAGDGWFEVA